MKKLTIDEIKNIELNILVDVTDFCERNNLDYFISCGTLLGAVRHKGFIPWDDDADITMPRDSYEKFISTYHSDNDFELSSMYTSIRYSRPFARVMSTKTRRMARRTLEYDYGVCIDIFPMDFFDSKQQAEDVYQHLFPAISKEQHRNASIRKIVEAVKKTFIWPYIRRPLSNLWVLKQLPTANRNARKRDKYVRDNSGQKGRFVSSLLAPVNRMPEIFGYSDIFPTSKSGAFEGHIFRAPNNTDKYLTALYGDYMNPPSDEKKKPGHYIAAYLKE